MATRQAVTALQGWWECPQSGCGVGGIHDAEAGPIVNCMACDYQACFDCEVPWHNDLTCAQYHEEQRNKVHRDAEKVKEEADAACTVEKTTKPCPGIGCGVRIEKSIGCHHMRCKCRERSSCNGC